MAETIDSVLEQYRVALEDAARLGEEATHLEHLRKIAQAVAFREAKDKSGSIGSAEYDARVSEGYREAVLMLHEVASKHALAQAKVTYLASRIKVWEARFIRQTKMSKGQ